MKMQETINVNPTFHFRFGFDFDVFFFCLLCFLFDITIHPKKTKQKSVLRDHSLKFKDKPSFSEKMSQKSQNFKKYGNMYHTEQMNENLETQFAETRRPFKVCLLCV